MTNAWRPTPEEEDALRRAGQHFGAHAMTPIRVSRLLGYLLPDRRDVRALWNSAAQGEGNTPLLDALRARSLSAQELAGYLPAGADAEETKRLLCALMPLFGWALPDLEAEDFGLSWLDGSDVYPAQQTEPVKEQEPPWKQPEPVKEQMLPWKQPEPVVEQVPPWMQPPAPACAAPARPPRELASARAVEVEGITRDALGKRSSGRLVVREDAVLVFRHNALGYAGALAAGCVTMGVATRPLVGCVGTKDAPDLYLPIDEIVRVTRLFVLGNYDLLLDMVNGHRLRICGNIMTVSKKEMEDVAQAIETLLSRRQGGIG